MVITAKLLTAKEDPTSNKVALTILFCDPENHTWEKSYTYDVTDPITAAQLKARVKADIMEDLKPKTYLTEVHNLVGKEFTFTI